jgi:hypothetical protein
VTQASHPAAVTADAVVRCRQPRDRLGVDLGAIPPRAAAPSRHTGRWQLEQGRVAPDLADDGVAAPHRGPDH